MDWPLFAIGFVLCFLWLMTKREEQPDVRKRDLLKSCLPHKMRIKKYKDKKAVVD